MIWRWEFENFCGHCPINKRFGYQTGYIKKIKPYRYETCKFCYRNVGLNIAQCPCDKLKPQEALKRAKDFIERFEAGEDDSDKPPSKGGDE